MTTLKTATGLLVWLVEHGWSLLQPGPVIVATLSMAVVALAFTVTLKVNARPLAPAATELSVKVTLLLAKDAVQLGTVPQLAEPAI